MLQITHASYGGVVDGPASCAKLSVDQPQGDDVAVDYQLRGRVAVITIDRPGRRNAVDRSTALLLGDAWRSFDADRGADVGILYGAGGHFSAGADLHGFDLVDDPGGFLGFTRLTVAKPTLAAVEGYCVAGGLEMALWCDLRVAGRSAVFGCFERRFGVPLVDGGTQRLRRVVGLGRALEMMHTGRAVEADEGLAIGLVNRVAEDGEALAVALDLAEEIAGFPQPTLRSDRRAALEGLGLSLQEGLEVERRLGLEVLDQAARGAARFGAGEGRSGAPVPAETPPLREVTITVVPGDHRPWTQPEEEREGEAGSADPVAATTEDDRWLPPAGMGKGLLVIHDEQGLDPGGRDAAARLARDGFVVHSPEWTGGDEGARALLGAVERLLGDEAVIGDAVGVVGFGLGGVLALRLATLDQRIAACVVFGARIRAEEEQPSYAEAKAAVLGHNAELDELAPPGPAYGLEMTLRELGLDATFHTYPRVGRFWQEQGEDGGAAARLAWERTRLFLQRSLSGGRPVVTDDRG